MRCLLLSFDQCLLIDPYDRSLEIHLTQRITTGYLLPLAIIMLECSSLIRFHFPSGIVESKSIPRHWSVLPRVSTMPSREMNFSIFPPLFWSRSVPISPCYLLPTFSIVFLCCLYGLLTVKVKLCSAHDAFSVCILVLLTRCFLPLFCLQVLVQDLLHPTAASEARKHKLKTLVQTPRSYFLDVKCPGCLNITTVFSHAQTAVTCESCATVLCTPTGGKAKLSEGTSFRRK